MNRYIRFFPSVLLLSLSSTILLLAGGTVNAQCPGVTPVTAGLRLPLGITQSNQASLLISETGTPAPHSGRISIVDPDGGGRRTLLAGLPSGINDVGDPSGFWKPLVKAVPFSRQKSSLPVTYKTKSSPAVPFRLINPVWI